MTKYDEGTRQWESTIIPYSFPLDTYLGEEILMNLKETPDRVVQIYHEENYEVTCDDLRTTSIRVAQNLIKLGIKADDVVSVVCRNSSSVSFLLTGCVLIGAPISPLDLSFTVNDLKHSFGITLPKLVVCDVEILDKIQQALRELNHDIKIFVTSNMEIEGASSISHLLASVGTEDDFVPPKFAQTADKKILAILCSSGTTGLPKGNNIPHAAPMSYIRLLNKKKASRSLCFSSTYWSTGFFPQMMLAFNKLEVLVWTSRSFNCELFSELLAKYKITDAVLVPIHLTAILLSDYKNIPNIGGLRKVLCCGAIVSKWLRAKFSDAFPEADMIIPYGMTECSISMTAPGTFKGNLSVGSLFPNLFAKVVDERDVRLSHGEIGEIRVRPALKFQVSYESFFDASTEQCQLISEKNYFFLLSSGLLQQS